MENLRGFARIVLKGYMAFALSVFASLFFSCSPVFADPTPNASTPTISIASDGLITYANQPEVFNSGSEQITVTTNNYTGYRLMISTSTTVLTNEDDSQFTISPITLPAGEVSVTNLNFGYGYGITFDNINYRPVTSDFLGSGIEIGSADTSGTETYTLGFGSKIDYATPNGSYSNVFVLTGIANPSDSTISYNENAGTDTVSNMPSEPTHGDCEGVVVLSDATPTRAYYHFLGWSRDADATVATYQPGDTIQLDPWENNSNITLYAIWDPYKYTVVFDKNDADATGQMANQQISYGQEQKLNKNAFEKQGYVLVGWTTTPDGSGTIYYDQRKVLNLSNVDGATVTLYGVWVEKEVLNFTALGDCIFHGQGTPMEGSCADISSEPDFLKTDVEPFNRENLHRSFYLEFTLQEFDLATANSSNRDTLFNMVQENSPTPANNPGVVMRWATNNRWQLTGRSLGGVGGSEIYIPHTSLDTQRIRIVRYDDGDTSKLYYQIGNATPVQAVDFTTQEAFNTLLSIGANLQNDNTTPGRFLTGTLRDIRFRFADGAESVDDIINYANTESGIIIDYSSLQTVFNIQGTCGFNGANGFVTGEPCLDYSAEHSINTGVQLFTDAATVDTDFIIEFNIDHYVPTEQVTEGTNSQNTLMNSTYEQAPTYPGIAFRRNGNYLRLVGRGGVNNNGGAKADIDFPSTTSKVRIVRKSRILCYSINDGPLTRFYDMTNYTAYHSAPVLFGSSITTGGISQRHLTGELSNMMIKTGHIGNDIAKYQCE